MSFIKFLGHFILIALFLGQSACTPTNKETPVKEDIQELSRLIKLPFPVKAVQWQVLTPGASQTGLGPNDWGLLAVIETTPEERKIFLAQTEAVKIDPVFPHNWVREWFPPALQALWKPGTVNSAGGTLQLNAQAHDARLFFNSPLQHGYFIPFGDSGQLLLYLFTN